MCAGDLKGRNKVTVVSPNFGMFYCMLALIRSIILCFFIGEYGHGIVQIRVAFEGDSFTTSSGRHRFLKSIKKN